MAARAIGVGRSGHPGWFLRACFRQIGPGFSWMSGNVAAQPDVQGCAEDLDGWPVVVREPSPCPAPVGPGLSVSGRPRPGRPCRSNPDPAGPRQHGGCLRSDLEGEPDGLRHGLPAGAAAAAAVDRAVPGPQAQDVTTRRRERRLELPRPRPPWWERPGRTPAPISSPRLRQPGRGVELGREGAEVLVRHGIRAQEVSPSLSFMHSSAGKVVPPRMNSVMVNARRRDLVEADPDGGPGGPVRAEDGLRGR